jgi:hypothetical protein
MNPGSSSGPSPAWRASCTAHFLKQVPSDFPATRYAIFIPGAAT